MALPQSALSELLEAFRTGEGVDLIRESVRKVRQELIEAEATEKIGAARYERTESRTTDRNGSRDRLLATQAGDVELRIPKLRKGSFFPTIREPRRRIDQALHAVVMEAYVNGVSTRSVDDLVAALGIDSGISKSEVSRICAGLDEVVTAFRGRRLDHTEFPYVYLDATYLHVRNSTSQVVSMAVVVATGITADGGREVLGLDVGDSEDEVFWRAFLTGLKKRGLSGVRLVISDQRSAFGAQLALGSLAGRDLLVRSGAARCSSRLRLAARPDPLLWRRVMSALLVGYARCSTDQQDLTAQRDGLRPGLREALAACRAGDTLVVTKLDRLARSLSDARAIADEFTARQISLSLGGSLYDPTDAVGRLLFNVLAMVAEFESDLIPLRTVEGMKVARAKGWLRGKQPKLNRKQEAHMVSLVHSGEYSTLEVAELYGVGRSTVFPAIERQRVAAKAEIAGAPSTR
jgi:DNA invertase Pin-like site-specific DNA recombinase